MENIKMLASALGSGCVKMGGVGGDGFFSDLYEAGERVVRDTLGLPVEASPSDLVIEEEEEKETINIFGMDIPMYLVVSAVVLLILYFVFLRK